MKAQRGFSLIELLMVVTIIGVIAAFAIPNLRRARQSAQSASAVQSMRTLTTAEHLYERKFKKYGVLADLAPEGTIDSNLSSGNKSGYDFLITLGPDLSLPAALQSPEQTYECTANPQDDPLKRAFFFVDRTAVIRYNDGAPADAGSLPIPR